MQTTQETTKERAILVTADIGEYDCNSSIEELSELAKTAGAEVLAHVIQKRPAYEPANSKNSAKCAKPSAQRS